MDAHNPTVFEQCLEDENILGLQYQDDPKIALKEAEIEAFTTATDLLNHNYRYEFGCSQRPMHSGFFVYTRDHLYGNMTKMILAHLRCPKCKARMLLVYLRAPAVIPTFSATSGQEWSGYYFSLSEEHFKKQTSKRYVHVADV